VRAMTDLAQTSGQAIWELCNSANETLEPGESADIWIKPCRQR
jgi:hypothetical protein